MLASGALVVPSVGVALAPSFAVLLVMRAAQGLCMPGLLTVGVPYVTEAFNERIGSRAMGLYVFALVLGGLVGRVGVALVTAAGEKPRRVGRRRRAPADGHARHAALAAPGDAGAAVGRPVGGHGAPAARNRALMAACLTGAGLFFSFMGVFSYIDFRLERPPFSLSPAVIGLVFVLWIMGAAGPLAGRLADRHGWRAVALGGLLLCAGGLTLSLVPVLGVVVVGLALVTLGNFSAVTAAQLGVAGSTDRDRGVASAMYFSGYYVAGALGAYVPGLAWEQWHWTGVWAMAIAAYALGSRGARRHGHYPRPSVRSFACSTCGQLVFFENTVCLRCSSELGFDSERREVLTLDGGAARCANLEAAGCNWLVAREGELCASCRLTRTRPADDDREALEQFRVAEAAKRWLLFELGELGLPVQSWRERDGGLAFDLLSSERAPVTTGHADGVITLDVAESDDAHREALREQLGEPYRTVLGHLRHEIGHYYWPLLVRRAARASAAGSCSATRARTTRGPRPPLRDRAAARLGGALRQRLRHDAPVGGLGRDLRPLPAHPGHAADGRRLRRASWAPTGPAPGAGRFRGMLDDWLPLTYALNALNRSMGRDDLYPFVLPAPVVDKLAFVHERVTAARRPG